MAPLRRLSLSARLAIVLRCWDHLLEATRLKSPLIDELLEHLWLWYRVHGTAQFEPWLGHFNELMDRVYAQEFQLPPGAFVEAKFTSQDLARQLEHTAEIIWGSFYSAPDDAGSHSEMEEVLAFMHSNGVAMPDLRSFSHSLISEREGWGPKLTEDEINLWRNL
jgi:hypothetical protein